MAFPYLDIKHENEFSFKCREIDYSEKNWLTIGKNLQGTKIYITKKDKSVSNSSHVMNSDEVEICF